MAILDKLDIETEKPTEEEIARKFGYEEDYLAGRLSKFHFNEIYLMVVVRVSINLIDPIIIFIYLFFRFMAAIQTSDMVVIRRALLIFTGKGTSLY